MYSIKRFNEIGSLNDIRQKHCVFMKEKLDEIGVGLECSPCKSLRYSVQETGICKASAGVTIPAVYQISKDSKH